MDLELTGLRRRKTELEVSLLAAETPAEVRGGRRQSGGRARANVAGNLIPIALTDEAKIVVDLQPQPGSVFHPGPNASKMASAIRSLAWPSP